MDEQRIYRRKNEMLQRDLDTLTIHKMQTYEQFRQNQFREAEQGGGFVAIEEQKDRFYSMDRVEENTLMIDRLLNNANQLQLSTAQREDLGIRRNRVKDFELLNNRTKEDSKEMRLLKEEIRNYDLLLSWTPHNIQECMQYCAMAQQKCEDAIKRCDDYLDKGKSLKFWKKNRNERYDMVKETKERYLRDKQRFTDLLEKPDMEQLMRNGDTMLDLMNYEAIKERHQQEQERQRQAEEEQRRREEDRRAGEEQAEGVNGFFAGVEEQQQREEERKEMEEQAEGVNDLFAVAEKQVKEQQEQQQQQQRQQEQQQQQQQQQEQQQQQQQQQEVQNQQVQKFGQQELDAMGEPATAEMQAVRTAITNIQMEMNKPMPPISWSGDATLDKKAERHIRKTALDDFCVNMVMQFAKLYQSIEVCLKGKKYGENEELKGMLEHLQEQTKMDRAMFRDKVVTYRSWLAEDEARAAEKHTWCDAWKYVRSESYDLDNNKDLKTQNTGSGASNIIVINDTKKNEKVYFRKEEDAGGWDVGSFVENIMETIQADIKCEEGEKTALKDLFNTLFTDDLIQEDKLGDDLSLALQDYRLGNPVKNITKFTGEEMCTAEFKRTVLRASEETKTRMGKALSLFAKKVFQWNYSYAEAKIDHEDNLTIRNVATSRLAQFLKIGSMVSDSRTAVIKKGDQHIVGNVMEESRGDSINKNKMYTYSNKAISQSFTLQVFDLICGQIDRHDGNFHVITKKDENGQEEIKSLKAIDNDMAFGNLRWEDIKHGRDNTHFAVFSESHIRAMPTALINRILLMKREYMDELFGDILDKDYIESLMDRVTGIQSAILSFANKPDSGLKIENGVAKFTGEDADDTLRMLKATKAYKEDMDKNKGYIIAADGGKYKPDSEHGRSLIDWKSLTIEQLDERIKARRMGGKIDPEENQA